LADLLNIWRALPESARRRLIGMAEALLTDATGDVASKMPDE
jgi:hypothetical protein